MTGTLLDPIAFINQLFEYAVALGGLLAFGSIAYGGFKYAVSAGNPGTQSDAKDQIAQALIGLALLLGSYLILRTINPEILNAKLPALTPIEEGQEAVPSAELERCKDRQKLAEFYNVPYPAKIDPVMLVLITCIRNHDAVRGIVNLRTQYTIDLGHPTCNYTRGAPLCEYPCSHSTLSCHYGGANGTDGALAVDFGVGQYIVTKEEYDAVWLAVKACGRGTAKMNPFGDPKHIGHMHISAGKCSGDQGWVVR
jgi:hypothetical protein